MEDMRQKNKFDGHIAQSATAGAGFYNVTTQGSILSQHKNLATTSYGTHFETVSTGLHKSSSYGAGEEK